MDFKHKNVSSGYVAVKDEKYGRIEVAPGAEVTLTRIVNGCGIQCIEQVEQQEQKQEQKVKKVKRNMKEDK